jgi:hypothetical protein
MGGSNKTRIGTLEAPTEACCKELNGGPRLIDPGGTVHDQVEDNNSRGRTAAVQGPGRCEGNGWERGEKEGEMQEGGRRWWRRFVSLLCNYVLMGTETITT